MQEAVETIDAWSHTMSLLGLDVLIEMPCPVRAEYHAGSYQQCAIRVLERHALKTATVAWSDATACCYGEQRWRRCVARKSGICALSGQTIAAGDTVYRPRLVRPVPRNSEAMILAYVMEAAPLTDVV